MAKKSMATRSFAVGVDLGGTKIAAGLFDERGRHHGKLFVESTLADKPRARTLQSLFRAVGNALGELPRGGKLAGIGVGSTGPLDPDTGTLLEAESLPNLFYYPLGQALSKRFDLPVRITNDGNAFALAEASFGAGRGHSIVVGITLGTGCGCGIVIAGRILEGATANAGEVYRAPVAGKCFDEVLSGRGLMSLYVEASGECRRGDEIHALARAKSPLALRAYGELGRRLAQGLGIIAAVLDPSILVLGGSVASGFRFFAPTLRAELARYVAPQVAERLRLVPSRLGGHGGALGGAALIFSGATLR